MQLFLVAMYTMSTASDVLLYDRSSNPSKDPNVFLKKEWVPIADQQNGVYRSNQSQVVTTALANDSRWASYRDAFIAMPLLFSLSGAGVPDTTVAANSMDYSIGYKNGFLQMIHSLQVSMGGSTIVQQTAFSNIWNHFKLLTSLSYGDILSLGPSIGFYPDNALSISVTSATATTEGVGTCNNRNFFQATPVTGVRNTYDEYNIGLLKRQQYINYDPNGLTATSTVPQAAYSTLLDGTRCNNLYKSYVFRQAANVTQIAVMAILPLKQLHSFFDNMPLCKGVNLTITMTLNQTFTTFTLDASKNITQGSLSVTSQSSGTNPLMFASISGSNGSAAAVASQPINASVYVGNQVQNTTQITDGCQASGFTSQVFLHVPVYTLDPVIEQAYLSSRVKRIMYTDIAQYLIQNVASNSQFSSIVTNAQAGLKSVLCVPYFTTASAGANGLSPLLSPFDSAPCTSSPLTLLNNFNVRISGQNMLMDNALYTYQTFLQHFYGCNSYAAGEQGISGNGLIGQLEWETGYCFHYVNCSRMPASELSVPKSVQIVGVNQSIRAIDIYVFTEFGCSLVMDVLSGARVE